MERSSVLVSFSPTGTTRTVLESIGQGLGGKVSAIDMTLPENRNGVHLASGDLLVIGFPVYVGRLPEMAAQIVALLPEGDNPVVAVVVYGNREYDDALLELADLCLAKGYRLVGAAAFIGQHSFDGQLATGRPDEGDRAMAKGFGEAVREHLLAGRELDVASLPGKRPYRTVPAALRQVPPPEACEVRCTRCGVCATVCPAGAIAPDNLLRSDPARCIMCAACIQKCPAEARRIASPLLKAHMVEIVKANMTPKVPAMFLPA